jgi:hypothetical protein
MIARFAHTRIFLHAARFAVAAGIAVGVVSCKETTAPLTPPAKPTGVTVVLLSSTSAKVTWTAAPDPTTVSTYNVFRNGAKVGEVSGPLFIDTGLSELATYRYGVSANGTNGLVSETSDDTPSNVITPPDATPPSVVSTSPANAATGVDRAAKISATFSESLDATTAVAANITVRSNGVDVPGTVAYVSAAKTIEFTPTGALPNGAGITVTLGTGIKDVAGHPIQSPVTFSFTTRDDVPPIVVSTSIPASGDVQPSQIISATMSESIDASSLTPANVRLTAAAAVLGTISYDSQSRTITFTPAESLSSATTYTFIVGPGIRDVAGNASTTTFSKSFRTADVTAPAVVSVSPADQATGVAVTTSASVVFSKDMDASTITTSSMTLRLTSSGAFVPGSVVYDPASRTATYVPSVQLAPSTSYTIGVVNTVRAANGVPLPQSFVSTFTTAAPLDVTPPSVTSVTPADGATSVALNASVFIVFSEPVNSTTITPSTITVAGQGVGAVSGSINYNAASSAVTFTPASALQNDVLYTVTVTTGVRDVAGNALATNFSSTFRTVAAAPPPDVIPPTVVFTVPAHAAADVAVNTPVAVTFSESMSPSSINGSTIFLSGPGGATVSGNLSYDNSSFSATFTPAAALQNGSAYTIVVTTGVTDVAGNALTSPYSAAFTTVAALPPSDTTPPTIVSTVPAYGSTNVFVTSPIRVTFSEAMTASSINTSTITVAVVGIPVAGSVVYDPATRTASFIESAGLLAEGKVYTVTVNTGVKDAAGNAMASSYVYSFQTQDLTPPLIVSRSPSRGATGVATNTTIRWGFSEDMIPSTINSSTVTLTTGGAPVAGTVSYDPNSQAATFTPSSALANNQLYMAIVTQGAKDLAGNGLYNADTLTFTTAPAPPAFDISGVTGFLGWWQTTTAGSTGIHFHIVFDQNGSTLTRSSSTCSSGGQDSCITLAQNQAGQDAIGPNSPGFAWVLVTAANGVLSGNQISFTMTNANGKTFTFNGTVNSPYHMSGTISGPTLPAETVVFDRPTPP